MASSKPTAVHFSLIFFVMLSVILGVVSYMMYGEYSAADAKRVQANADLQKFKQLAREKDDQILALKQLIGHEFSNIGIDDPNNPNTVLGAMRDDMRSYGGDLNVDASTYSATLAALRQQLDTVSQERDALQANLVAVEERIDQLKSQLQSKADQYFAAKQDAGRELQDVMADKEEEIAAKSQKIASLEDDYQQLKVDLEQAREQHNKQINKKDEEIKNLTIINDQLREELDQVKKVSFERPDGLVRRVDHTTRRVWINLGEADNLTKRTSFSVYTKDHNGVARGEEDIKGAIEVTRVTGPHLAEARIVKNDIHRPIAPGDPVYSPLWEAGRETAFSFVGLIDLDGDGQSDRDRLHDLVRSSGAKIDNEVDAQGEMHGDGIDVNTKFLVIGKIPDPTETSNKTEQKAYQKIIDWHGKLKKQARQQGVRIINLNRFLAYIGYEPHQRLWRPGENVPWMLKAGSHSTAVNEPIGDRSSSGQVSDVFSRSKQLKQPVSSGQTSKIFGGGSSGSGY